jgi:hypothetical protein
LRIVPNGSVTVPRRGRPHNPPPRLRDSADESAQPMLDRDSPFDFSPSDALEKTLAGLFWQILEEH